MGAVVLSARSELLLFYGDWLWDRSKGTLRIMVAAGGPPLPYKEGTTDEEIIFGKTGNSAFDSLDTVRLHLGGRG
jgi:hypothetical protein